MSAYEAQANKFLTDHGITLKAAYIGCKCPRWCDDTKHVHGAKYRITLKRSGKSISFDFWNSYDDMRKGRDPSAYDVLACISSDYHAPDTFENFCAEYGYDEDSRKALATFKAVERMSIKLRSFLSEEEADDLSAIH